MVELNLAFNHKEGEFSLDITAANRINELINIEGRENEGLLLSVKPGGCAGFIYDFNWASLDTSGKKILKNGATLIIKEADLRLIGGGELKFINSLSGSKFEVINPKATNSCGCGKSFS